MINCVNEKTAPQKNHWAIIQFKTIYIKGWDKDDYYDKEPASTYTWYDNEKEWLDSIRQLKLANESFVPIIAQIPEVCVSVSVKI